MSLDQTRTGRPRRGAIIALIFALVLVVGAVVAVALVNPDKPAQATTQQPPPQPSGVAKDPKEAVVVIGVEWKTAVLMPTLGTPKGGAPALQPTEKPVPATKGPAATTKPTTIRLDTYCSEFFVTPDGLIATAEHCFNEDMVRAAMEEKLTRMVFDTDEPLTRAQQEALTKMMPEIDDISSETFVDLTFVPGITKKVQIGAYLLYTRPHERGGDLAFVKATGLQQKVPYLVMPDDLELRDGDVIKAVGVPASHIPSLNEPYFPGEDPDAERLREKLARTTLPIVSMEGKVSGFPTIDNVDLIEHNAGSKPGMSGGPIVNGDGKFVGVTSGSFTNPAGTGAFNYFTGGEQMRRDLEQYGVQPAHQAQAVEPAAASENGLQLTDITTDQWVVIGAVAVAFVLLVAALAWFVARAAAASFFARQPVPAQPDATMTPADQAASHINP